MTTIASLIAAEQARARRMHPDDHAGIARDWTNLATLNREVAEVAADVFNGSEVNLIWELIQVAGVAAAWADRLIANSDWKHDDILQLIEEGASEC